VSRSKDEPLVSDMRYTSYYAQFNSRPGLAEQRGRARIVLRAGGRFPIVAGRS